MPHTHIPMNNIIHVFYPVSFAATTLLTVWFFYKASAKSGSVLLISCSCLLLMAVMASCLYLDKSYAGQSRVALMIIPGIFTAVIPFFTLKGKMFVDRLQGEWLSYMHVVRVPVEILFYLFISGEASSIMTDTVNLNILTGYTAPFIGYFGYREIRLNSSVLWIWNLASAGLLLYMIFQTLFYTWMPFTYMLDEQEGTLLDIPFIWLMGYVVPILLFSHMVCIRQLLRSGKDPA